MGLRLDAGTYAAHAACAPTLSPPDYDAFLGLEPVFDGTVLVGQGDAAHQEPYHLALAVSSALLQQAGHAFYELGGLCLVLTPERLAESRTAPSCRRSPPSACSRPGCSTSASRTRR